MKPGAPIPPLSVVKLISDWHGQKGREFRIGYYNPNDGLDCVWLVNDMGKYEQTTDQDSIREDFLILSLSEEDDLYGENRPVIQPLNRN